MKFRGFSARTRWLRWGLAAVAAGIVLGSTAPGAARAAAILAATQHDALPWYASRLLAFLAYWAMAGSVVYGLLLSTKLLDAFAHRPISIALHQDLASIGLGLAGVHGILLTLDKTVPTPLIAVVVPFAGPYRPVWVGIGQVAFYLAAVVVGSFYVRRRIGQRAWRLLHYVTFLSFAGATGHGLLAGTDSGSAWAWWGYVLPTVVVVFLTTYRVGAAVAGRSRASSPAKAIPVPESAVLTSLKAAASLRAASNGETTRAA